MVTDNLLESLNDFQKFALKVKIQQIVEYHYSSPDDITNINGAYNKAYGSVTKLRGNFKGFSFGRSELINYLQNLQTIS